MTHRHHGRTAASVLAVGLACAMLAATPTGSADELRDRKNRVEARIDSAEEHLDQSSSQLTSATERLAGAVQELATARTVLTRTRGELVAAQALDVRMQAELADAVKRLSEARAALARSRQHMSRREAALRALVVQQNTAGGTGLMAISTVLSTQDTADLTQKLASYESVVNAEAATLARLTASQATLQVQESTVEELKRDVAVRRAAAAANLAEKERLQAQAEQTESQIASLVTRRAEARQAAAQARSEDLRLLEQLEQEKADISALLRERAEAARRAAEAAARRAAAERAAAAERDDASGSASTAAPEPAGPAPAPAGTSGLASPVDGYLTSSYGMRFHPIYQVWKLHDGTDFGAACGTPVRAAADGTVISMYYNSGYGNRVIIDHGLVDGVALGTTYNHLSGYAASVGQTVRRGDVIGYVGTTGASTGCHLHFMVFENGVTVDPMTWL